MQAAKRTQQDRRAATRQALVAAARRLFAEKGYAETGTPQIVAEAGVTRGALYHHFDDKLALFQAVVEEEQLLVAMAVNAAAADDGETGPVKALVQGGDAYLDAMQEPGRRRILLVDAPALLGREVLDAIDARHALKTLIDGLEAAIAAGAIRDLPAAALAHLLGAMFDRAALAPPDALDAYRKSMRALIRGLRSK